MDDLEVIDMEMYSPSHVTEDAPIVVHGSQHDDRTEVDYGVHGQGSVLQHSRFSSSEADPEGSEDVQKSDLRAKLESKRRRNSSRRSRSRSNSWSRYSRHHDRRSRSRSWSRRHRRSRSRDRSRNRSRDRSRNRSRDRSRGRSRDRSRGRSRDRSRGRSRDRSRGRSRDRSRGRSRDRSRGRSRDRSEDKYRSKGRSRSRDRSSRRSSGHYKKENLDIEIRIKNESQSNRYKNEESHRHKNDSSSHVHNKYSEEHYKKLTAFKKTLEQKFNVSVDSIVNGILDTKSSTEIKDLLKVDIDQVSKKNYSKTTAKYEQCMHCGKLFIVNSPPGPCVKCQKPRDEASLEAISRNASKQQLESSRQPVAFPPFPMPFTPGHGQWPMLPSSSMPIMPPMPMPTMPPGTMPQLPGMPPPFPMPHNMIGAPAPQQAAYTPLSEPTAVSTLPAIRGHVLLPPGIAPPEHMLTLKRHSGQSGSNSSNLIIIPDSDQKRPKENTDIEKLTKHPDPQSFDVAPPQGGSSGHQATSSDAPTLSKDPSDLLKTLVTRKP